MARSAKDAAEGTPRCRALRIDQSIAARMPAPGTRKTVRPATRRQVVLTSLFGGELALKLADILRKRRARHARTLPVVAC